MHAAANFENRSLPHAHGFTHMPIPAWNHGWEKKQTGQGSFSRTLNPRTVAATLSLLNLTRTMPKWIWAWWFLTTKWHVMNCPFQGVPSSDSSHDILKRFSWFHTSFLFILVQIRTRPKYHKLSYCWFDLPWLFPWHHLIEWYTFNWIPENSP